MCVCVPYVSRNCTLMVYMQKIHWNTSHLVTCILNSNVWCVMVNLTDFVSYMKSAWFQEVTAGRYLEFCVITVHVLDVCMQHCFSNFLDCRRLLDSTYIYRTQYQKWIRRMEFLYGIQRGERNTNLEFICNIPGVRCIFIM